MAKEAAMQTNVELVQMLYKAFLGRRIDTILEHCSGTITSDCVGTPAWVPLAGTHSGKDAVRCFFEDLAHSYTFEGFSPNSFHDAGDHVFCFGHSQLRPGSPLTIASCMPSGSRTARWPRSPTSWTRRRLPSGVESFGLPERGAGQLRRTGELWKRLQEPAGHPLSVTATSSTGRVARHVLRAMI
jgi:hypothetical protein